MKKLLLPALLLLAQTNIAHAVGDPGLPIPTAPDSGASICWDGSVVFNIPCPPPPTNDPTPVPEPETLALLGVGLVGLWVNRKKKK